MNNTKVKEIIKFSFYKNIQNKWFIFFNILTLISIVIMLNWSLISNLFKTSTTDEPFKIAVLDNSNLVFDDFYNSLIAYNESSESNSNSSIDTDNSSVNALIDNSSVNTLTDNSSIDALTDIDNSTTQNNFEIFKITENTYTAENIEDNFLIVEVTPDDTEGFKVSIISKEGINTKIYNPIVNTLFEIRNSLLSSKYSIADEDLKVLQSDLNINRVMLAVDASDSSTKELIKLFSSALTYLITIIIFSKMANEIAQEKQSKSSEYILTTVSAKEYLFAKIFSNIAILIIQCLLLFVYYFMSAGLLAIFTAKTTDITLTTSFSSSGISVDIVLYLVTLLIFSILNLILLCIIQATISAKTSSTSEASNTVSLLVFAMMAGYIATIYIFTPYTKVNLLLNIISCIPLLSAYFVPAMMVIGQANILQIAISLILLIVSIPLTFNYCSKIFKNGILDYTKIKKKKENPTNKFQNTFFVKREMRNIGFVIGISIIIYIGVQSIFSLLLGLVLPPLLEKYLTNTDITLFLQMILQIISIGLSAGFVLSYCDKKDSETKEISKKEKVKIVFIALFLLMLLQVLLTLILYPKIGLDYDVTDLFEIYNTSSIFTKIISLFAIAIVPAIFEELLFRKAIIDFTSKQSKTFALLASSLLFGFLHMNLSQGLFAFIVGLIFGAIYLYTKDIKLTMLIHFINNGYETITLILPDIGILLVTFIILVIVILGFILLVKTLFNKESRAKLKHYILKPVNLQSINLKYKYVFTDYIFDISIILVFIMSILTENLLR